MWSRTEKTIVSKYIKKYNDDECLYSRKVEVRGKTLLVVSYSGAGSDWLVLGSSCHTESS